ncbi:MAG: FAD-dependent monooxygenase [Methylobacterium sp.]|nr:FAD-dependent monooxygenase [Methylobacterium sp.]
MSERILIAGAGPAGAATALAMLRAGLPASDIAVLDAMTSVAETIREPDSRILALNAGSCRFLESLGVWPALAAAANPMRSIALSDTALEADIRPLSLGFAAAEGEPLARLVPLGLLQKVLRSALAEVGVILRPEIIRSFREEGDKLLVETNRGRQPVSLLVGADGARSAVRRIAGIPLHGWAYGQVALTGIVEHSGRHHGEAIQHFLPGGPFALLPLEEGRSSMVWSERAEVAKRMLALPPEELRAQIDRRAAGWRGTITGIGRISSHPLSLGLARRFVGPRLALVADAAHVVHPLAGQGLNLGFGDAATLAEIVIEHLRVGLDPGDPALLERYQARRRPAAAAMAAATEGLNRLFSNAVGPLRVLRDAGLNLVNRSDRLKDMFRQAAAGRGAHEPRLFRGEPI